MLHFLQINALNEFGLGRWRMVGLWLWLLAVGVFLTTGCRDNVQQFESSPAFGFSGAYPIKAVATVGMVGDIVRAVGGEHIAVEQMLGAGVDPHLYRANRDDVRSILKADIVFYSGLMLEGKMIGTLEKVSLTRPIFAVTDAIPRELLLGHDDVSGHPDPHVWMDPSLWQKCVQHVERQLCQYDPKNEKTYRENSQAYQKQLTGLFDYARESIASIPESRRVFVTSHDAFQYFGRAFQIDVMGIQGLSTESEAGLRRVNELVDLLVARKVQAVFFESSVPQRSIEALVAGVASRGHQLELKGPMFSDAMGAAGTYEGTYIGMIDHNVTLVTRSLGGTAPLLGWQGLLNNAANVTDVN